jgi:hypothetical protein
MDQEVKKSAREIQREAIEGYRARSRLDPLIPLGADACGAAIPESGVTVREYFQAKHRRGEFGEFYGLHVFAFGRRLH